MKLAFKWIKRNIFKISPVIAITIVATILVSASDNKIRIALVGDTGTGEKAQYEVAKMIDGASHVYIPGDVIYEDGISSASDWQLESKFYKPFAPVLNAGSKIVLAMGNHDHLGSVNAWLDLAKKDQRIVFPNLFFMNRFSKSESGGLCIVVVDTDSVDRGNKKVTGPQEKWLDSLGPELDKCDLKGIVGHHPCYSAGDHGNAKGDMIKFCQNKIFGKFDFYVAGHDHNLENYGEAFGTHFLVSGAGGKLRDLKKKPRVWAESAYGYIDFIYDQEKKEAEAVFYTLKNGKKTEAHRTVVKKKQVSGPISEPKPEEKPEETPGDVLPISWQAPGLVKSFQIMHIGSLQKFKNGLRNVNLVNLELDQIEKHGGKAITDHAHSKGVYSVCYTSSGYEEWRSDAREFPNSAKGGRICKNSSCTSWWKGENWGNPKTPGFYDFHEKRVLRSKAVGCKGIEFDNIDWAFNKVGYSITESENLEAIRKLSDLAHKHGLAYFAKNTPKLSTEIAKFADGVFIESCAKYSECHRYSPYAGKAAMMLEYSGSCKNESWAACNRTRDYFENFY